MLIRWVFHGEPYDPPFEPGEAHLYHQDQVGEVDVDQLDQLTEAASERRDQLGEGGEKKSKLHETGFISSTTAMPDDKVYL